MDLCGQIFLSDYGFKKYIFDLIQYYGKYN